jgi:hypothetical protein
MKKGSESALTIITSVLLLIVVFMVYYFFFILSGPNIIEIKENIEHGENIALINFVRINYDLILNSTKTNDYALLEKEFTRLYYLGDCVNLEINQEVLRKDDCISEERYGTREDAPNQAAFNKDVLAKREEFTMQMPNYDNKIIKIRLRIKNE